MSTKKVIVVIGAGPSGLVTIKALLEEGHRVICFEKAPDLGGLFRFDRNGTGVWESCVLTSSSAVTGFSDFPIPSGKPFHLPHDEYLAYLKQYADKFDLLGHIQFGCSAERVHQLGPGQWQVQVKDQKGQRSETQCDGVAVCSGVHQVPYFPKYEGQELFKGEIFHSSTYKNALPFTGKKVLIIGAGESGADLISEVADVAQTCGLSLRRGVLVMPRLIRGYPNDYYTTRLAYAMPNWFQRQSNPAHQVKRFRRNLVLWTLPLQPLIFICQVLLLLLSGIKGVFKRDPPGLPRKVKKIMDELYNTSGGDLTAQFSTKSERFVYALANGSCVQHGKLKRLVPGGAVFEDGHELECDTLLYCTGFTPAASFLDVDIADGAKLYKNVFHTELEPSLAFIGFVRPGLGSLPPISEMQARWYAQVISGAVDLPTPAEMRERALAEDMSHRDHYSKISKRLPYLVDYTSYMDEIAGFVGCRPHFKELVLHPSTMFRLYCGPFITAQYRISGPHANKDLAFKVINRQPVAHAGVSLFTFIVFTLLFKLLDGLGLDDFKRRFTLQH